MQRKKDDHLNVQARPNAGAPVGHDRARSGTRAPEGRSGGSNNFPPGHGTARDSWDDLHHCGNAGIHCHAMKIDL